MRLRLALFILIALILVAPTQPAYTFEDGIYIVTTYPFLEDILDIILLGIGDAEALLKPGVHPSTYEFTPIDSEKVWLADIFLYVGIGSELAIGLNGAAVRDGYNTISILDLAEPYLTDENPYFWHDPIKTLEVFKELVDKLANMYPEYRDRLNSNLDALEAVLVELDMELMDTLSTLEERRLFTVRNGLKYFAERYGLEIAGYITASSGVYEPSTAWVVSRLEKLVSEGLTILFVEYEEKGTTLREVLETIAEEAGIEVVGFLVIETLAPEIGVYDYFDMLRWNALLIADNLGRSVTDDSIASLNPYKGNPILEPLGYEFLVRGFITLIVLMAVTSAVGSYAVLRGWSIFSDALGHGAIVGLLMAYLLLIDFYLGALAIGIVIALIVGTLDRITNLRSDAIIAISFTTMLAIAILIISSIGGVEIALEDVLFADVTAVSSEMMYRALASSIAIAIFLFLFHRHLLLYSIDPIGAISLGIRIGLMNYIFLGLLAVATVSAFMSIGAIPAIAALIIPPSTAYLVSRRPKTYILLSSLIGVVSGVLGYYISYYFNVNAGAATIIVSVIFFLIGLAIYLWRKPPTPHIGR